MDLEGCSKLLVDLEGCSKSEGVISNGIALMRSSSEQTVYSAIYASVRLPVSLVSAFSIVNGYEAVIAFAQVPCIWDVNIQNFCPFGKVLPNFFL